MEAMLSLTVDDNCWRKEGKKEGRKEGRKKKGRKKEGRKEGRKVEEKTIFDYRAIYP